MPRMSVKAARLSSAGGLSVLRKRTLVRECLEGNGQNKKASRESRQESCEGSDCHKTHSLGGIWT